MENHSSLKDEEILAGLCSGNKQQEDRVLISMYQNYFGMIQSHVLKNNGKPEDAEDIFWTGLEAFWNKARQDDFSLSSTVKTYFYSICKYKWLEELRRRKRKEDKHNPLDDDHQEIPADTDISGELLTEEKHEWLWEKIRMLSEKCVDLLTYFYVKGDSMKQIAEALGFSNSNSAKSAASKCRKQLTELIMEDPHFPM
jgi:RNA polymerase sigma factor (sigma-70 family)